MKTITIPKLCLLICNSGASNSGTLTGLAAMEIVENYNNVGILSLPALVNRIPKQMVVSKKIPHIFIIDGCKNSCAKKIASELGLSHDAYLNLENDLGIEKLGPFTTLKYSEIDVKEICSVIERKIGDMNL